VKPVGGRGGVGGKGRLVYIKTKLMC